MNAIYQHVLEWISNAGWVEAAEAFFVGMSIVGQHFIARRQAQGFYFWIVGNVVALALFASLGRWMTVALYAYFLWKAIEGIRVWRVLDAGSSTVGSKALGSA